MCPYVTLCMMLSHTEHRRMLFMSQVKQFLLLLYFRNKHHSYMYVLCTKLTCTQYTQKYSVQNAYVYLWRIYVDVRVRACVCVHVYA